MKTTFKILTVSVVVLLAGLTARSEDAPPQIFCAKEIQADVFASVLTSDFDQYQGGYGVGVSYFLTRHFGIGLQAQHSTGFDFHDRILNDAALRGIARLPIGNTRFAPYMYVGVGYNFGARSTTAWIQHGNTLVQERRRSDLHFDTGLGAEYRFTKFIGVFAEGGAKPDFDGRNTFIGLAGLRIIPNFR